MRAFLTSVLEVAGFGLVTAGAVLVALPLGLVVGGVSLILIGYLTGRRA